MTFFTIQEFKEKYNQDVELWQIEASCEKIYEIIGLGRRGNWDESNVPEPVKNASMEQLRFMLEYDIPFIDYKGKIKAGEMESELKTDISTLAQAMLGNNGFLYRGTPMNTNMSIGVTFDIN